MILTLRQWFQKRMQILKLREDYRRYLEARGQTFSLRDFHDFVWRNGNVPMSLQRWELLGDRGDVDLLDAAGPWYEAPPESN